MCECTLSVSYKYAQSFSTQVTINVLDKCV